MKLSAFYDLAAKRADELGAAYWTVMVKIITGEAAGPRAEYGCYMPEATGDEYQRSRTPEGLLQMIGALPAAALTDDSELPESET